MKPKLEKELEKQHLDLEEKDNGREVWPDRRILDRAADFCLLFLDLAVFFPCVSPELSGLMEGNLKPFHSTSRQELPKTIHH